jgi:hypothetical protein
MFNVISSSFYISGSLAAILLKRSRIIPIFYEYKVDIVFASHDHIYARSYLLRDGSIAKSSSTGNEWVVSK